jgi:hypothetical protein
MNKATIATGARQHEPRDYLKWSYLKGMLAADASGASLHFYSPAFQNAKFWFPAT